MKQLLAGLLIGAFLMTVAPAGATDQQLENRVRQLETQVNDYLWPMSAHMDLDGYYHGPLLMIKGLQQCRGKVARWERFDYYGDQVVALDC